MAGDAFREGEERPLTFAAADLGKTSSIELFAAKNYENMVKIDFVERPEAIELIGAA